MTGRKRSSVASAVEVLTDVANLDPVRAQHVTVVAGLIVVHSSETLDVVDHDDVERALGLLGVLHHLHKCPATDGAGAADGIVDVELAQP